jgi:hypothetical protein
MIDRSKIRATQATKRIMFSDHQHLERSASTQEAHPSYGVESKTKLSKRMD